MQFCQSIAGSDNGVNPPAWPLPIKPLVSGEALSEEPDAR